MSSAQSPLCYEHSTLVAQTFVSCCLRKHPPLRPADQTTTSRSTSVWRRTSHLPADNTIRERRRPSQRHKHGAGWGGTSFTCHGVLSRRTTGYRTGTCSSAHPHPHPPPPPPPQLPATPPSSLLPTGDRTGMNFSLSSGGFGDGSIHTPRGEASAMAVYTHTHTHARTHARTHTQSQRNSHRVFWRSDAFHVLKTFSLLTTTQLRVTVSKRDNM